MKIKKLVFQNINSLYGKWEIDFECEKFRQSGIFAITGKTGSGKTTILDAMTLALYGSTPRLNKSTAEAVSRGCCECMSELTFLDTNNREWTATFAYETIRRGPRKGGMRETAIHRLSCDGKTLADKTTEVKKMVEEITGLDATRFCRAVLLAQGSFDAFLEAGSDNGEILERITGTEVYSRIAAKLKERYDAENRKLETIKLLFKGIQVLSEEEAEKLRQTGAELEKEILGLKGELDHLNKTLQTFQQLEQQRENLKKCAEQEELLAEELRLFAPQRKRFEDGKKVLEADELYRPYMELQKQQNVDDTALQKKLQLRKEQEELCASTAAELEKSLKSSEEYVKEFEKLNELLKTVLTLDNTIKLLESACTAAGGKRRSALMETLEQRKEIRSCREQLRELQKEHSEGSAYLSAHKADGGLEVVQKLCIQFLEAVKKSAQEIAENRRQETLLRRSLEETAKNAGRKKELLDEEEKKFSDVSAELEKQKKDLDGLLEGASKEHWTTLAEKQEQCYHQALVLRNLDEHRKQLKAGEPCPLCGAVEHPFALECKAEPEKEKVELEKSRKRLELINSAEEIIRKTAAALELCGKSREQLGESLKELTDQKASKELELSQLCTQKRGVLLDELAQNSRKIEEALAPFGLVWEKEKMTLPKALEERIREFARHNAAREIFESRERELKERLMRLQTAFETQWRSCLSLKAGYLAEKAALAAEKEKRRNLFGTADPTAEGRKAEEKRQAFAAAKEKAQRSVTEAATNLERTRGEAAALERSLALRAEEILSAGSLFKDACTRAGITEEEFRASVLEKEEMTALAARDAGLQARQSQLAETRKNCEEAIASLCEVLESRKSREETAAEVEKISGLYQEKNQTFGALREKLLRDAEGKRSLAEQHKNLEEQQNVMTLWNRMYELIGSKDKFQRFAQGITLEHLLLLANQELAKLSGRYRLLRSRKEELGIDVADRDQGDEIRSSRTLSGGERFLVSLSLALGLSRMAGEKIRVDSLFLDEGFGTLDAENLDTALEALSNLRNRGKLVGVISHVAAFSEKIPCTIEVSQTGGGRSTLRGPGVVQRGS